MYSLRDFASGLRSSVASTAGMACHAAPYRCRFWHTSRRIPAHHFKQRQDLFRGRPVLAWKNLGDGLWLVPSNPWLPRGNVLPRCTGQPKPVTSNLGNIPADSCGEEGPEVKKGLKTPVPSVQGSRRVANELIFLPRC